MSPELNPTQLAATSTASGARGAGPSHDFDFFFSSWKVRHHQLKARLAGSADWLEFTGTTIAQPMLGGQGNVDDNILDKPGGAYRAATIRAFDPKAQKWSIWWLDGRHPDKLSVPTVGSFEDGVGTFLADDTFEGKAIKVRFLWSRIAPQSCRWEQAYSEDGGKTWEINWIMDFTRVQ